MSKYLFILFLANLLAPEPGTCQPAGDVRIDFYGDSVRLPLSETRFVDYRDSLSDESIAAFFNQASQAGFETVARCLLNYKQIHKPDDWLFYQLIRKTAQAISPKTANYHRYTLYKWFFLCQTGYDARLAISQDKILFYVQCSETIYNIPTRQIDGKQYVCLNYHDYGSINFAGNPFSLVPQPANQTRSGFSYRVTNLPSFEPGDFSEKNVQFTYNGNEYSFQIKVNPQIRTIFANYPVVDYATYFNIPLNQVTYRSFIPAMRKAVQGMTTKDGVDYLLHFTRYAFLFRPDEEVFGQEKRLTPEQTLLFENSDCEDRAGLFFFLVKELYDLPMVVLQYPRHVSIAVCFDKAYGNAIEYNGARYSVCEPSSQQFDLRIGELPPALKKTPYEISYAYKPASSH